MITRTEQTIAQHVVNFETTDADGRAITAQLSAGVLTVAYAGPEAYFTGTVPAAAFEAFAGLFSAASTDLTSTPEL